MNFKTAKQETDKLLEKTSSYKKPEKFYTSYSNYILLKKDVDRCNICYGTGLLVADGEFCDPVEGYKNARRVNCYRCEGAGKLSEPQIKENYNIWLRDYKNQLTKHQNKCNELTMILEKISLDDLKTLEGVL